MTKKEIYAAHGIEYKAGKINAPIFGWTPALLIDGNAKLGKGVWTWSTLPGTGLFTAYDGNGDVYQCKGTCSCDCAGCYAKSGNYRYQSNTDSLARKTALARLYPDFVRRAIIAQIQADKIELCRIHAAGDFESADYVQLWHDIVTACPMTQFWTYTKYAPAESAFDDLENINIVKSIIPGIGLNFGHCDHIINAYQQLESAGASVHVCRCGIDPDQHCTNCKGCATHDYVLFVEHSTGYKAAKDPLYNAVVELVESQAD